MNLSIILIEFFNKILFIHWYLGYWKLKMVTSGFCLTLSGNKSFGLYSINGVVSVQDGATKQNSHRRWSWAKRSAFGEIALWSKNTCLWCGIWRVLNYCLIFTNFGQLSIKTLRYVNVFIIKWYGYVTIGLLVFWLEHGWQSKNCIGGEFILLALLVDTNQRKKMS